MMKRNDGFTLIELLISIVVGTLVTAAASTLLLLGFRINAKSTQMATQQNEVRLMLEVIGTIVSEEAVSVPYATQILDGEGNTLVSFDGTAVKIRGTELLKAEAFSVTPQENNLLQLTVKIDGKEYKTSIYCRLLNTGEPDPQEGDANILTAYAERNYREVLAFAVENAENPAGVTEFLEVLASQYGSRGQILNEAGESTGEYFSQWYIGGYEENPGWSEETPWCACYLSWAMAQCGGLEEVPRFANVDNFWVEFVTERNWSASEPVPGDIVFFDWIEDEHYDPQHVGAVLAVLDGWVYTVEGNSGGRVAVCRYELEDPGILGYGKLNWK